MKTRIEEIIHQHNEMYEAFQKLNGKIEVKTESKFKIGDYLTIINSNKDKWIGILRGGLHRKNDGFPFYAGIDRAGDFRINSSFGFQYGNCMSLSTPEEIALLDSKLAEQGKRFDKEKCEIVEIEELPAKVCSTCVFANHWQPIPAKKKKELIVGEMAILWDTVKSNACCAIFGDEEDGLYYDSAGCFSYAHAIPFESVEQYKQFIKS